MFEAAELGRKVSKEEYGKELPGLRSRLLQAQTALRESNFPVIVIISGADGAGKGEIVHRLNEWLDPRGIDTHAFWKSSDEEQERPLYWRFWRALPARKRIGILFGSWYSEPIVERAYGNIGNSEMDAQLDRIAFFERMLTEDGAIIIKLWFHLSKKAQRKMLKALESDPKTHWRVLPADWKHYKLYGKFRRTAERAIRHTDTEYAPWHIIEAADKRYRELATGQIILQILQKRLKTNKPLKIDPLQKTETEEISKKKGLTVLDRVDLSQKLSAEDYDQELAKFQGKLSKLSWEANRKKISTTLVFEGWDAAGKGSAIRRVTSAIDPRLFKIVPVSAPTDEERAHHYLWRFWRQLPREGRIVIFDRSWYGRVLVERVEGFAQEKEWMRSYLEMNDFEEQLSQNRIAICKFWIHISKQEQLRRFKEREENPVKRYKITEEDWRNRKKWGAYESAVNDMVARTSTEFAPWTLVAGNDKRFARIQILKTICHTIEKAL